MKHITLLNGTIIRNEKQAASEFFTVHALHEVTKNDLATLKSVIKENDAIAWFRHGISVHRNKTNDLFDKDEAKKIIKMLSGKLGYSENKTAKLIARCTKKSKPFVTISKAT